jgi:hypothetical protein
VKREGVAHYFPRRQQQKSALCFLACGTSADHLDDYIRMAETTVLDTVSRFCSAIIDCFSETYLRFPLLLI